MSSNPTLSSLLVSKALRLAYSVPLLLISMPLLFAGTFLTLDRTRSFPSSNDPVLPPGQFSKVTQRFRALFGLRGGVGGLLGGYIFGVQLTTLLSFLIPAHSYLAPLSSSSFFAVWILSSIVTTLLGGRYRYCALIFSSLCGGASLALALCVIIHPPLLGRQVLVPLFSIFLSLLTLIFCIPRFIDFLHPTLRAATASSGSFGLVVAIALLEGNSAWGDIWQRLYVSNGEGWGTSKETGLSVAYCIFICLGMASDWALRRWLGECPDEKWDKYLANYAANLPNDPSRAGFFQPLPHSFLGRLFYPPPKKDVIFPSTSSASQRAHQDSISKDAVGLLAGNHGKEDLTHMPLFYGGLPSSPGLLKKNTSLFETPAKRTRKSRKNILVGRKEPIKFGGDAISDSSDDESATAISPDMGQPRLRPWLRQESFPNSTAPTLVEISRNTQSGLESEPRAKKTEKFVGLDHSDHEGDLGVSRQAGERIVISRHGSATAMTTESSRLSFNGEKTASMPLAAVPATPSLIKALDRVAAAQKQAFGTANPSPLTQPTSPQQSDDDFSHEHLRRLDWGDFWKDVRRKAGT